MNRLILEAGQYAAPDQILAVVKVCPVPKFGFHLYQRLGWLDAAGRPFLLCDFSLN